MGVPDGLVKPSGSLDHLMDGLDSSWYMLDRVVFGSFVGVIVNAGKARPEAWKGLKNCWTHMCSLDATFCGMLETGESVEPDAMMKSCENFTAEVDAFGPQLNRLGMSIACAYLVKVPTCWVEHMDVLARTRVLAVELTGEPNFEFAGRLMGLHRQKLEILGAKLEKSVFHLNSKMMRNLEVGTITAATIFSGMMNKSGDVKTALAAVAGRYGLPVEFL